MSALLQIGSYAALAVSAALVGIAVYMRLIAAENWDYDTDPITDALSGKPNAILVRPAGDPALIAHPTQSIESPVFAMSPRELETRLERIIFDDVNAGELPAEGPWRAFIVRSKVMGFPDYVTVRTIRVEGRISVGDSQPLSVWLQ